MPKRTRPMSRRRRSKVLASGRKPGARLRQANLVTARQALVDFHAWSRRIFGARNSAAGRPSTGAGNWRAWSARRLSRWCWNCWGAR